FAANRRARAGPRIFVKSTHQGFGSCLVRVALRPDGRAQVNAFFSFSKDCLLVPLFYHTIAELHVAQFSTADRVFLKNLSRGGLADGDKRDNPTLKLLLGHTYSRSGRPEVRRRLTQVRARLLV